jgi:crotonobetainyl-CoA:carnitine CoA-transferase CaiB-like acyl-CoA transferase
LQHRQAELRAITDPAKLSAVLCDVVEEATSTRSTDACLALLAAADVPAGPVLDLDGHLADPQVEHNGVYVMWDDPRLGPIRGPRYPARSDAGLAVGPRPAPGLDEHRDDVLGR